MTSQNTINSSVLTAYFISGYLFRQNQNSLVFFDFILVFISVFSLSLIINYSHFPLLKYLKLIKLPGIFSLNTYIKTVYAFLIFLYLYGWWFFVSIVSWEYALLSLTNIIMFIFSVISALILVNFEPDINTAADKNLKLQIIHFLKSLIFVDKPGKAFIVIALIMFPLFSAFTNNTGLTPFYQDILINHSQENRPKTVILKFNGISLDEIVTGSVNDQLPYFSRAIGSSVVSAVDLANREKPGEFWNTIFRSDVDKTGDHSGFFLYPADINNFDQLNEYGLTDFFKSLLFVYDKNTKGDLVDINNDIEPVWDTAERYGLTTGIINSSISQKHTRNGFFIGESCFYSRDTESESTIDQYIYPIELKTIFEPSAFLNSATTDFENLNSESDEDERNLFEITKKIKTIYPQILQSHDPDLLIVGLDLLNRIENDGNIDKSNLLKICDSFLGYWQKLNVFDNFIIIGRSNDQSMDSFILYNSPYLQYDEKMTDNNINTVHSNILYMLSLPLLDGISNPLNSEIFDPSVISSNPPKYVKYYPPLVCESDGY